MPKIPPGRTKTGTSGRAAGPLRYEWRGWTIMKAQGQKWHVRGWDFTKSPAELVIDEFFTLEAAALWAEQQQQQQDTYEAAQKATRSAAANKAWATRRARQQPTPTPEPTVRPGQRWRTIDDE